MSKYTVPFQNSLPEKEVRTGNLISQSLHQNFEKLE